jgi:hypothetical protein
MRWYWPVLMIVLLAALVPFSSERPDALQRVLGLPGGSKTFVEAVRGILVVTLVTLGIAFLLQRRRTGRGE